MSVYEGGGSDGIGITGTRQVASVSVRYPTIGYTDPLAYTVYREANIYYARNNEIGHIEFTGADPAVVVQACLTAGGAGTVVGLWEGNFVALIGVAATANNQGVVGLGVGTYWDATALLTGVHGFTITGFTGCELKNFTIETEGGGGKISYPIFIEDGADDFRILDITIANSDGSGVHIQGTTIERGTIHRVHIEIIDGDGIFVNMDDLNYMYRLHVDSCVVGNTGARGMCFVASAGNLYWRITNNIVYNTVGTGIYLVDGDYSTIRGNICIDCATGGMELNSTSHANVLGNTCLGSGSHGILIHECSNSAVTGNVCHTSTQHGIFISDSDNCTVTGNTSNVNVRHGIYLGSGGGTDANNCTVTGNTCIGNDSANTATYDGINVEADSEWNTVTGNTCIGNHRYGIYILGAGNTVNSNVAAENDRHGIWIGVTDCKINDNTCYHNGVDAVGSYDGIFLDGAADRCTINGNTCYSDGARQRHGIVLDDGAIDCTVNGNICYNHESDGIRLAANNDNCVLTGNRSTGNGDWGICNNAATSDKCIIVGNHLLGNTAGALQDNGTLTEVGHNVLV